jgi:hypothetical protein
VDFNRVVALSLSLGLAAFVTGAPQTAFAQEALSPEVLQLKQQGTDAFMQKDWPTALQKFEQAYAQSKDPTFLYNQARTLESMQELPRALDAVEEFDKLASAELKAKVNGLAEVMTSMRARVATLTIRTNVADAEVRINDRVIQKTVLPETRVRFTRGPIKLSLVAEGYLPCLVSSGEIESVLAKNGAGAVVCELKSRSTTGILHVRSTLGASLRLDGTARGMVPFDDNLTAGPHSIELSKEGFEQYKSSVVITAGQEKTVQTDLVKTPGITSQWWFWTAIGVVVVGAGTAVTVYALNTERDAVPGSLGTIKTGFSY